MAEELGVNKHMVSLSGCFGYSCTSGRDKGGPSQRLWEVLRAGPRVVPGRRYQPGAVPPQTRRCINACLLQAVILHTGAPHAEMASNRNNAAKSQLTQSSWHLKASRELKELQDARIPIPSLLSLPLTPCALGPPSQGGGAALSQANGTKLSVAKAAGTAQQKAGRPRAACRSGAAGDSSPCSVQLPRQVQAPAVLHRYLCQPGLFPALSTLPAPRRGKEYSHLATPPAAGTSVVFP